MPLETILQTLESEAAGQVDQIKAEAQAKIEALKAETEGRAEAVRQDQLAAIQLPLKAEQARIINQARSEALQIVLGTREEFMSAAMSRAAERLAKIQRSRDYARVLRHLAEEAIQVLGSTEPVCFRVRQTDVNLMRRIVQDLELTAEVEADLVGVETYWDGGLGGLIAATPDGRLRVVNTLEIRLQRVGEIYRSNLADWLFETNEEG